MMPQDDAKLTPEELAAAQAKNIPPEVADGYINRKVPPVSAYTGDARILSQVRLTDRMRKFLSHPGTRTSAQHAIAFQTAFNLSPVVAGRLVAEFVESSRDV